MNDASTTLRPQDLFEQLRRRPWRWLGPTLLCGAVALVYALVKPPVWEASQTCLLRGEGNAAELSPGQFRNAEEMKVAQETMLEVARSGAVLRESLLAVGPESGKAQAGWPSAVDVADLQEQVKLSPPNGAEFGKTEIAYLKVRQNDPQRAIALTAEIAARMCEGMQRFRDSRAQSLIDEYTRSAAIAEQELAEANRRLTALESQVGRDLGELRMLDQSATGDSDLRRMAGAVDDELRQARAAERASEELLRLLNVALEDESQLLAMPNRLLESQPALRRLKDGLVDAQLRTAQLEGAMKADHPQVRDAREAEREVHENLRKELRTAVKGLELEMLLARDRVQTLETQKQDVAGRLTQIAGSRAQYSAVVAEVRQRTSVVEEARRRLAAAQAAKAGASSASLVTLIDKPMVDARPVSPGRSIVVLAGLAAGLAVGLGLVFLSMPSAPTSTALAPIGTSLAPRAIGAYRSTPSIAVSQTYRAAARIESVSKSPESTPLLEAAPAAGAESEAVGERRGSLRRASDVVIAPPGQWTYHYEVSAR